MTRVTFAVHNVLRTNTEAQVRADLFALDASGASVMVLNEVRGEAAEAVYAFRDAGDWHVRAAGEVWLLADPTVWDAVQGGTMRLSDTDDHGPGRRLVWQELRYQGTRMRHVVVGTHLTAGYAREDAEAGRQDKARAELLRLLETSAGLSRRAAMLHLLGDLNAAQGNTDAWWYPSVLLDGLYRPDPGKGLLYMLHSRTAHDHGLELVHRWQLNLNGDHPAQLKTVAW